MIDSDGSVADGAVDSGKEPEPASCGEGTTLVDGKCVAKPMKPIGAACKVSSECASGTCAPEADNLPGGMCTVIGCSMDNPCPNGSTCYKLNSSISLCMPFCDRGTACRTDENYHCQPLYTTDVNICAPSCELSKSCSAGTRCNPESGLCELAECEVGSETAGCTEDETCYKDSKGLSSKGGLCLHLCETEHPEKNCNVEKDEVCQPLPDDPAKGFCAPPVCTKNGDCPAGAECQKSVCLAPPTCDGDNPCADDKTCVSGKCMPKCPSEDKQCSDIHPGLVCADVLATPACLPLGSFPGSDCRPTADNRCDSVTAGSSSVPMVCEQDKCLADCTTGGDSVCSALSDTLQCASGVFSTDLCLPKGSFPGGACGADNSCAQDLNGDPAVDMSCVSGTCVVGCSESEKWPGYGDALCSLVDPSLTCASKAGSICVRACGDSASCDTGYTCFDSGSIPAHENACLPTGSFPGSPCRSSADNQCDSNIGGNDAVDMVCSNNTCVVACPSNNDALCAGVDSTLTCSESAGNICVLACSSGACPTGYSCLDPGGQNACLPTGSFPGSPCGAGNQCDSDVGGNEAVDMQCVDNTCVVSCPGNNDVLCAGVNSALTCAESAGNICVLGCVSGACLSGYSCLDPGASDHQNACLPTGSFPGSPCRADVGDECDQNLGGNDAVDMTCNSGACVVTCAGADEGVNDALCGAVSSLLTCAESADHLCVYKCASGACTTDYSCLDPAGENACLPNGTFPGSTCRSSGTDCDDDLGGNTAVDMECVDNVCLVGCATDLDALCIGVDSSLTCSETSGNYCMLACDPDGECPTGYSCLDPGGENACLPDGSFPGSACRTTEGDECDQDLGGDTSVDMQCVDGTCLVGCATNNDALCTGVDSELTCSESSGNICVLACDSGSCPTGYSCLDPGGENACLPDGSFPGSACRATSGDECDEDVGPGAFDMTCVAGSCAVVCPGDDDVLCGLIDTALTCYSPASICVPSCEIDPCPLGLTCGAEDACIL